MRVLDLFSGIGGFSLGLERAGMRTVAFCEIDPFCRRVLAKHWPDIHIFDDVRTLSSQHLTAAGIAVDVICGGFPCQDISDAGLGAGLDGERSGLWRELARLIGEVRPRYAIVENVSALLTGPDDSPGGWMGQVLGDLAALGYDAEWHCISASAVGASHVRDRVWIIAYPDSARWQGRIADHFLSERASSAFAINRNATDRDWASLVQNLDGIRTRDGVPVGMVRDEIRCLGNAVVPFIPEMIGRAIMAAEAERTT